MLQGSYREIIFETVHYPQRESLRVIHSQSAFLMKKLTFLVKTEKQIFRIFAINLSNITQNIYLQNKNVGS